MSSGHSWIVWSLEIDSGSWPFVFAELACNVRFKNAASAAGMSFVFWQGSQFFTCRVVALGQHVVVAVLDYFYFSREF